MSELKYYSTNLKAKKVSFSEALLKGLAPDKGLFLPESIPTLSTAEIAGLKDMPYHEIAYTIISKFLVGLISEEELRAITKDAYDFDVPLEPVYDNRFVMRLDQGPTASFKDFAARMMGRLMNHFLGKENKNMLILTATSGDTGSAIANAFYGLDNINVLILYPDGEVTDRQRKQMTTLQKNIQILCLKGKFDDCQALVKQAFSDSDLDNLGLSSANSINIGRLIPQSVYYAYAWSRLAKNVDDKIIFSVPSGNFGDLMGGIIAMKMGIPVEKFVISTNDNDEVPEYFKTNVYKTIVPSKNCISSAMNVGHPSNMARIIALYGGVMDEKGNITKEPNLDSLKKDMWAISVSDNQTREMIKDVYNKHNVLLEPHGSVGWYGLEEFMKENSQYNTKDQLCVALETAHPAKFPQEINDILNIDPELPDSLKGLEDLKESFDPMDNNYESFKQYLQKKYKK